MNTYYLKHHGIEGQKWGVQNGPPYPLALKDHSAAEKRAAAGKNAREFGDGMFRQNIKAGKDRPNQSRAEQITKATKDAVNSMEDTRRALQSRSDRKLKGKSAEGMSDDELRRAINRIEMEKKYASLTKPETKSGFVIAGEILSIIGTTVTIAAATATIASTLYTMAYPNGYKKSK